MLIIAIGKVCFSRWYQSFGNGFYPLHRFDAKDTQPIRGIMALLIVATHVSYKFTEGHYAWGVTSFGAPIVSTFFFLSGYGLCVQYSMKGKNFLKGFVFRSFKKIIPVFLLACFISIILSYFLLGLNPVGQLLGFLTFNPPLPYSWFIYALLIFYLAFYFDFKYVKSNNIARQIILFVFTLCEAIIFRLAHLGLYWYISLFAFNVGTIYGSNKTLINNLIQRWPLYTLFTLIAVISTLSLIKSQTTFLAIIPLGVIIPLLILGSGSRFSGLVKLGHISYEIYLAHGIIIPIVNLFELPWVEFLVLSELCSVALAYLLKITLSLMGTTLKKDAIKIDNI